MKKKLVSILLCVSMVSAMVAGCGSSSSDETSRMWKKTEKGVAGWKLPLTETFENYL